MTALYMERPDFFHHDLDELGRWWTAERMMAWEGFTRLERIEEAERRFAAVWAMRDQYAWRVCVLCRTWIDDIGQLHLGRLCGHQVLYKNYVMSDVCKQAAMYLFL
jgi:hypothetical protein